MSKKALIAMSGGVDSSVAAYLMMKKGFECTGVTMKLYREENSENTERKEEKTASAPQKACSSEDAVFDAANVAEKMGIPFSVLDLQDPFKEKVIRKFVRVYLEGHTPNPCIDCNHYLKFGALWDYAKAQGMDYMVSGHYAQIEKDEASGRYLLKKGLDISKDQSYVLYNMTQELLSHTIFPLGSYSKTEIRSIAAEQGFINADRPDSQDICFVPDGDYAAFIERLTGEHYPCGDFVLKDGRVVGQHKGLLRYTLGQRRGLGVAWTESLYVVSKSPKNNTVLLGRNEDLFSREFDVCQLNLIAFDSLREPLRCKAKNRYRHKEQWCRIEQTGPDRIHVVYEEAQRAITPGQACVFYDGDLVLGGGTIM